MTNKDYKPLTTGGCVNSKMLSQYRDRLCYLEDCIENGTLVFLPCKVGDTVYKDEDEFNYMCQYLCEVRRELQDFIKQSI